MQAAMMARLISRLDGVNGQRSEFDERTTHLPIIMTGIGISEDCISLCYGVPILGRWNLQVPSEFLISFGSSAHLTKAHNPSLKDGQLEEYCIDVDAPYKTPRPISIKTTTLLRLLSCRFAKKTMGKMARHRATAAEDAVSDE
jgi:hypothetical protein